MVSPTPKYHGLNEDPSRIVETTTVRPTLDVPTSRLTQEQMTSGIEYVMPHIEAIHEGRTLNYVRYAADKLMGDEEMQSGVYSWTEPYPKPVIYNHDVDTKTTGRIVHAMYQTDTRAGRGGIIVIPRITDEAAIKGIMNEELLTVSIGATTDSATCNICGTDIIRDGFCGHWKGDEHDGQTIEWIAGNLWFDELSWVNVPADQNAQVIDQGAPQMVPTSESTAAPTQYGLGDGHHPSPYTIITASQNPKGDDPSMTELEQKQKELDEAKAALATEQASRQEAEQKLATAEAEKTALQTEKQALETEKTQLEERVTSLESEKQQALTDKEAAEAAKSESESAKSQAEQQVEQLSQEVSEQLVERATDLRVSVTGETKEQAQTSFANRSVESLKDSIDLMQKQKEAMPRTPHQAENPGSTHAPSRMDASESIMSMLSPRNK